MGGRTRFHRTGAAHLEGPARSATGRLSVKYPERMVRSIGGLAEKLFRGPRSETRNERDMQEH